MSTELTEALARVHSLAVGFAITSDMRKALDRVLAAAEQGQADKERLDYLDRQCSHSMADGRVILRAPAGKLREYIDNARNPRPLGPKP